MKSSKAVQKRRSHKYRIYLRKFSKLAGILKIAVLVSTIPLVSLYLLNKYEVFVIKDVEIEGAKSFVNSQDLKSVTSERVVGARILSINNKRLRQDLKDLFQGAKDIKVSKKFPSTIHVKVTERVPIALVKTKNEAYLIDDEGYVLGLVDPQSTNLPEVTYTGEIKVGFFIDKKLVPVYLSLISSLDKEGINVSSISIQKKRADFYIPKGTRVTVSTEKDTMQSVQILGKLLEQLQTEGRKPKRIDLRYDKVVVSY